MILLVTVGSDRVHDSGSTQTTATQTEENDPLKTSSKDFNIGICHSLSMCGLATEGAYELVVCDISFIHWIT